MRFLLLLLILTARTRALEKEEAPSSTFIVGGYLPDYRSYINVNATAVHLTDIMLFSLTPESILKYYAATKSGRDTTSDDSGGCCLSSHHYEQIRKAKSYKQEQLQQQRDNVDDLRLLLTVGGGGRSNGFADFVVNRQNEFVNGLVQLCRDEELDGIDLDFEGIQSQEQWKSYLKFISVASTTMKQHDLLLTVALHPGQLLPAKVCENIDRVHVMTYDMMKPSIGSDTNHKRKKHHASMHSVQEAIKGFIQNGCPPSKLVMGIPAYGRHGQNMGSVKTYSEIIDGIMSEEEEHNNNSEHELLTKFIQSTSSWKGYQFDSPNDIRDKVKYAIQTGLGGVFIWELGQDKQIEGAEGGILLEAAASLSSSAQTHGHDSIMRTNDINTFSDVDHQEL